MVMEILEEAEILGRGEEGEEGGVLARWEECQASEGEWQRRVQVACSLADDRSDTARRTRPSSLGRVSVSTDGCFSVSLAHGGRLQVGSPTETLKAALTSGQGQPPSIFLLPPRLIDARSAVFLGDVEFPIFFSFFVRQGCNKPEERLTLVGSVDQLRRMRAFLKESLLGPGPDEFYPDQDYTSTTPLSHRADLPAEIMSLAFTLPDGTRPTLDHFVRFAPLDDVSNDVTIGDLHIIVRNDVAVVYEGDAFAGACDMNNTSDMYKSALVAAGSRVPLRSNSMEGASSLRSGRVGSTDRTLSAPHPSTALTPPYFGITWLGTSHGFHPGGRTSGFILWVSGRAVLVDPPFETPELIEQELGMCLDLFDIIICTHCHADHDAGTLRLLSAGRRMEVVATATVIGALRRKYAALVGSESVESCFRWRRVRIGRPELIYGASFDFDYSYHVLPCLRFRATLDGRVIACSGDTQFNPTIYADLVDRGVMTSHRRLHLEHWIFACDLVVHEAGVPPIHTRVADLNALPRAVKQKIRVVHIAELPEVDEEGVPVTDLFIPTCGVAGTEQLRTTRPADEAAAAARTMRKFLHASLSTYVAMMEPRIVSELVCRSTSAWFEPRQRIIERGRVPDNFYVIMAGTVSVLVDGEVVRVLRAGESFGETALRLALTSVRSPSRPEEQLHSARRVADVVANEMGADLLVLPANEFSLISLASVGLHGSKLLPASSLHRFRSLLMDSVPKSVFLSVLNADQIDLVATLLRSATYTRGDVIIAQGDILSDSASMFVIYEGRVRVEKNGVSVLEMVEGDVVGEISLLTGMPRTASVVAASDTVVLLELQQKQFQSLMDRYNNIRLLVSQLVSSRLTESQRMDESLSPRQDDVTKPTPLSIAPPPKVQTEDARAAKLQPPRRRGKAPPSKGKKKKKEKKEKASAKKER